MLPLSKMSINLIQMSPFSTTTINANSNAAVDVVGFCTNQLPAFPLPALRSTLGNILDATLILIFFPKQCISVQNSPSSKFKQGDPLYTIVGKGSDRVGEKGLQY